MKWFWFAGVICSLIVASGCGGGGGGKASTPAGSVSDDEMRSMVMISSEGLPWEITLQSDGAESNEQAASQAPDPEKWAQNYQQWGRIGGHAAIFGLSGNASSSVQTGVEAYESSDGAGMAFSALFDFVTSDQALNALATSGFQNPKVDRIDAAGVGDESGAYRMQAMLQGQPYDAISILLRRGAILGSASVVAPTGAVSIGDVEAVAKQMDQRIQDVLNKKQASTAAARNPVPDPSSFVVN